MSTTTIPTPTTVYNIPRRFKKDAKLHPYLASKTPEMIKLTLVEYTLYTVLSAMRQVISREKQYDPNNTTVITCKAELEEALGMKSLHVTEVRDQVCLQMEVIDVVLLASLPPAPIETVPRRTATILPGSGGQRVPPTQNFDIEGRYWVKPLFLKVLRQAKGVNPTQVVFTYRQVTALLSQYIMDKKSKFFDERNIKIAHVENDLLGTAFNVKVFHRTQVTALMRNQLVAFKTKSNPIVTSSNNANNGNVAIVGKIKAEPSAQQQQQQQQQVSFVHRADNVAANIKQQQLTRHQMPVISQNNKRPVSPNSGTGAKEEVCKRARRRSSFSIAVFTERDIATDEETIYSLQGYETTAVGEVDNEESNDTSDTEIGDLAVYDVEFEPEDPSSEDEMIVKAKKESRSGHSTSSDEDSEIDDGVVIAATTILLQQHRRKTTKINIREQDDVVIDNDDDDKSSCDEDDHDEAEDEEGEDFALETYDPETRGDLWKCLDCKQPNTPFIRYCSSCYTERKGWLPVRPKPKKAKRRPLTITTTLTETGKHKKTSGISVKSSGNFLAPNRRPVLERSMSESTSVKSLSDESTSSTVKTSDTEVASSMSSQDSGFCDEEVKNCIESSDEDDDIKARNILLKAASVATSQPSMLCTMCCYRPKDACFVHGKISHQVCCYPCAKKLYRQKKGCPVCRRRIEKITKNILA